MFVQLLKVLSIGCWRALLALCPVDHSVEILVGTFRGTLEILQQTNGLGSQSLLPVTRITVT
jgi:hypothetical protein